MNYNQVIGIDPGVTGGIAIIKNNAISIHKMPTHAIEVNGKNRNETDIGFLQDLLLKSSVGNSPIVFIEKVNPRPSDATEANNRQFQIARMLANYEVLKTVVKIFKFPLVEVPPRTWQDYLRLVKKGEEQKDRKNRYKRYASQLIGRDATLWNADAICIAQFGNLKVQRDIAWINERIN